MKGYVQEPETSDFKTEGWGEGAQALRIVGWAKLKYPLSRWERAGVRV